MIASLLLSGLLHHEAGAGGCSRPKAAASWRIWESLPMDIISPFPDHLRGEEAKSGKHLTVKLSKHARRTRSWS